MTDRISISIPNKPEYVGLARLVSASIGSISGMNLDDMEDLKVAVGEAVNNAILHGSDSDILDLSYFVENGKLTVEVVDSGMGFEKSLYAKPDLDNYKGNGLGIFIMESLMDEVKIDSQPGNGTRITLVKNVE